MGNILELRCKRCDRETETIYLLSVQAGVLIKKDSGLAKYISRQINQDAQLCPQCMAKFIDLITGKGFFEK